MVRNSKSDASEYARNDGYRFCPHDYLIAPRDLVTGLFLAFVLGAGVGLLIAGWLLLTR
jgi:hypothetical protein